MRNFNDNLDALRRCCGTGASEAVAPTCAWLVEDVASRQSADNEFPGSLAALHSIGSST